MQTQKPLSAFTAADLALSNFPACIFAITPESVGGAGKTLTDRIGGVVFTLGGAGTLTNNGDGSFSRDAVAGSFTKTSGTMPTPGSGKDMMLVVVGSLADAGVVTVGDSATGAMGSGFSVNTAGSVPAAVRTNLNYKTLPDLTKAGMTTGAMLLVVDNSADSGAVHVRDTVVPEYETAAIAAALGTLTGAWDIVASNFVIPVSVTLNGIYLLQWIEKPPADECKSAVAWMSANPTLGLYPGWLKRT